jgi:hypothetical protein
MPRAHDITVCLVGFEEHKARPDRRDPSGFWFCAKDEDASPFVAACLDDGPQQPEIPTLIQVINLRQAS